MQFVKDDLNPGATSLVFARNALDCVVSVVRPLIPSPKIISNVTEHLVTIMPPPNRRTFLKNEAMDDSSYRLNFNLGKKNEIYHHS